MSDIEQKFTQGDWAVAFVDCNEGYNGDFDPDDEGDVALLRVDMYYKGEPVDDDGSFCTYVRVNPEDRSEPLDVTAHKALTYLNALTGMGTRRCRQRLSYLPYTL